MRLFEHEAKALLAREGIATPRGELAHTPEQAGRAARAIGGRVAVKAQVLTGGRMHAGGVRFAEGDDEARAAAQTMRTVYEDGPAAWLVEEALPVARELYLGVTYDDRGGGPVAVASLDGGIDVEAAPGGGVARMPLSTLAPAQNFRLKELLAALAIGGRDLVDLTTALARLLRVFERHDLLLAEINPMAQIEDGRWVALDAHLEVDDDALGRQADLLRDLGLEVAGRPDRDPSAFEIEAARIDRSDHRGVAGRVVAFEGSLGLLIGGGGASLTAFDAVRKHGGSPANYSEIGGNPSVRKVAALTRLLLGQPGVERIAVIMNVVNNTRSDLIARGVIRGCLEAGHDPAETIAVFRVPGAWEDESVRLLRYYGVEPCDRTVSIDEAARRAVGASR